MSAARLARGLLTLAAASAALGALAACSDDAPPHAAGVRPVAGPIAGAPIDGGPAKPVIDIGDVSSSGGGTAARAPAAPAAPAGPADPAAPAAPAAGGASASATPDGTGTAGASAPGSSGAGEPSAPTAGETGSGTGAASGEQPAAPGAGPAGGAQGGGRDAAVPEPPATAEAGAAASPLAPLPPTTAQGQPKPDLPEKPVNAGTAADGTGAAAPGVADPVPADAAARPAERKSLLPADRKKDEPVLLSWEQLASFDYEPPPPVYPDPDTGVVPDQSAEVAKAKKQIPAEIWELEGELITVEGFMIPLEYTDDGVKSFLLSRHAMGCCFGVMPRPHELVECDMGEGRSVPYIGYLPVKITGKVHVGPKDGPQTVLSGIYTMLAPTVTFPKPDEE